MEGVHIEAEATRRAASASPAAPQAPVFSKMTPNDQAVLRELAQLYTDEDWWCANGFKPLSRKTGLDVRTVRLSARRLARKGLAKYERTLWTEDGDPCGAGYRATKAGADLVRALSIEPQRSEAAPAATRLSMPTDSSPPTGGEGL